MKNLKKKGIITLRMMKMEGLEEEMKYCTKTSSGKK